MTPGPDTTPRELLTRLLDYIAEQARDIDPGSFRLANAKGFLKRHRDLAGLPGVEFDVDIEGDHLWLRVQRLQAGKPPAADAQIAGLLRIGEDPFGAKPAIDEAALRARLAPTLAGRSEEERAQIEARARAALVAQEVAHRRKDSRKRDIVAMPAHLKIDGEVRDLAVRELVCELAQVVGVSLSAATDADHEGDIGGDA
jgi:hypothetical protein